MRVEISRYGGKLLLLAISLLYVGCSGNGAGDTVPSPPRELVEKSFHPPGQGGQPNAASSAATDHTPAPAGK
jgi:hypothetical protein